MIMTIARSASVLLVAVVAVAAAFGSVQQRQSRRRELVVYENWRVPLPMAGSAEVHFAGVPAEQLCYCTLEHCAGAGWMCKRPADGKCYHSIQLDHASFCNESRQRRSSGPAHQLSMGYCHEFGCLAGEGHSLFNCKAHLIESVGSIACCDERTLCNRGLAVPAPLLPPADETGGGVPRTPIQRLVTLLLAMLAAVLAALVCLLLFMLSWRLLHRGSFDKFTRRRSSLESEKDNAEKCLLKMESSEAEVSSGSGRGQTKMVQRSLAHRIDWSNHKEIGRGRYGVVFKVSYNSEDIALKKFFTHEEACWEREIFIYKLLSRMQHENILIYKGSEINGTGSVTEMYVLMKYEELGSLHDYLFRRQQGQQPLSAGEALGLAFGACSGLGHLHDAARTGTDSKPRIAHRDVKSKNMLVRNGGDCVIADFGLAVFERADGTVDLGPKPLRLHVGTKRYMAPELLDGTMNTHSIEAFCQADIYSFALVLWELSCAADGTTTTALTTSTSASNSGGSSTSGDSGKQTCSSSRIIPYGDVVPSDPSIDEMTELVVRRKARPALAQHWAAGGRLGQLAALINECWTPTPTARLSAFALKKKLAAISSAALPPDPVPREHEHEHG